MIGFLLGHIGLVGGLLGAGAGVASMVFPEAALAILKAIGALPKPVFIAACGLLAFLSLRAEGESRRWHKQSDRYEKLYNQEHSTLERQRKESKRQQAEVGKVVDHYVTVTKPQVVREREKIESAPLPGSCKTPQAVMEAGV